VPVKIPKKRLVSEKKGGTGRRSPTFDGDLSAFRITLRHARGEPALKRVRLAERGERCY